MTARYLIGDVRARLAELDDNSVDLVMTSPPFLALRSYLPADHPDKDKEIGSEPDPGTFIDVLAGLVDDLARVLAPHGSMVFELGDTYAGSGGAGGDYGEDGLREGQPKFRQGSAFASRARGGPSGPVDDSDEIRPVKGSNGWPRAKSLALVPEIFRFTLAYGFNPLTGTVWWEGDDRWMVRNVVDWVRPNPPVGALGDKFRPATSDLAVFTRDPRRWFDLDAVRTGLKHPTAKGVPRAGTKLEDDGGNRASMGDYDANMSAGAPPLDWWNITTSGYPGAHYATYPAELCVIPVKSMCPERVCVRCGEPSRRITGGTEYTDATGANQNADALSWKSAGADGNRGANKGRTDGGLIALRETVGWSDCGHGDYRHGCVLDPFAGTGTTLAVATGHGRDAIGIDLDERNAELALGRVGPMFLEVVE